MSEGRKFFTEFDALDRNIDEIFDETVHTMWNLKNKSLEPLAYINETKDKVVIKILSEGERGLYGMSGGKLSKVRVTLKI